MGRQLSADLRFRKELTLASVHINTAHSLPPGGTDYIWYTKTVSATLAAQCPSARTLTGTPRSCLSLLPRRCHTWKGEREPGWGARGGLGLLLILPATATARAACAPSQPGDRRSITTDRAKNPPQALNYTLKKKIPQLKLYMYRFVSVTRLVLSTTTLSGGVLLQPTRTRCVDSVGVSRCGHSGVWHAGTWHVPVQPPFPGRAGAPPSHPHGFFQLPHHRVRGQAPPAEPPCRPRPRRGGARGARR